MKKKMKTQSLIIFIILLVIIATFLFFVLQRVDRFLDLKAISDCASEYRIEFTDTAKNTKIVRPLEEPFRECIWNKGIRNWQGTKN